MGEAGEEYDRAAQGMAKAVTAACGYGVKVIPKRASTLSSTSDANNERWFMVPSYSTSNTPRHADGRPNSRGADWSQPARGA